MKTIVILHGWNDTSASFTSLAAWLRKQALPVVDIYLGDYVTKADEVTLFDLGFAFERALAAAGVVQLPKNFNLIVHSTGGLVAREYLRQVCSGDATRAPIEHLVMLAPANFGSPLASLAKSVLGRLFEGWNWNTPFQTGQQVLNGLELASAYSWDLADADLFDPAFPVLAPQNVLTTVLAGTIPYDGIQSVEFQNGSDNVVFVSTASLNAHRFTLDFSTPSLPMFTQKPRTCGRIALAVFPRDHTDMHDPNLASRQADWQRIVLAALNVDPAGYSAHAAACDVVSYQTFSDGMQTNQPDWYHQYMHVVFRCRDQYNNPINDFVIEFYQENNDPTDVVFQKIHKDIIESIHNNSVTPNLTSFLMDTTDLNAWLTANPQHAVRMSASAAALSDRISYRNPPNDITGGVEVFGGPNGTFIFPNEPVLVDVILSRDPTADVFKLTRA